MAEGTTTATAQEQTPGSNGNEGGTTVGDFQAQGAGTPASPPAPQTHGGAEGEGAGDGKSSTEGTNGTGDSGEGQNQDLVPDSEGKFAHPDTGEKIDAVALASYYKEKFSGSTSGAQKLLDDNKTLTSERDTAQGDVATLTKKVEELTLLAEGKNPEGLELVKLQEQLTKTTEELAVLKEDSLLDSFEKTAPLAANKREALRSLSRANPKESLQKLWDDHLKAGAEADEAKRVAAEAARKEGAGDQGGGTSTREPAGGGDTIRGPKGDTGLTQADFDKLPVKERGRLLASVGL
jgi:hypothetical protein